eukprot:Nk52_evm70s164 gene=Nk52_evmTU70s164
MRRSSLIGADTTRNKRSSIRGGLGGRDGNVEALKGPNIFSFKVYFVIILVLLFLIYITTQKHNHLVRVARIKYMENLNKVNKENEGVHVETWQETRDTFNSTAGQGEENSDNVEKEDSYQSNTTESADKERDRESSVKVSEKEGEEKEKATAKDSSQSESKDNIPAKGGEGLELFGHPQGVIHGSGFGKENLGEEYLFVCSKDTEEGAKAHLVKEPSKTKNASVQFVVLASEKEQSAVLLPRRSGMTTEYTKASYQSAAEEAFPVETKTAYEYHFSIFLPEADWNFAPQKETWAKWIDLMSGNVAFEVYFLDGKLAISFQGEQQIIENAEGMIGQWTDFILNVIWDNASDGVADLSLMKNRNIVYKSAKPNCLDEKRGPAFAFGVWRGSRSTQEGPSVKTRTANFDEVLIVKRPPQTEL